MSDELAPKLPELNKGTVKIETARAVSEVHGMMMLAKQYPRDEIAAFNKAILACRRLEFAEKATYSYPRAGQTISGASIRLAEELARCWGNMDYGIKELSQSNGETEMMAYAWDMETNTRSSQNFKVKHVRTTKSGSHTLTDQRDIYENNANNGGRRLRARILAILPPDLVTEAVEECKRTINNALQGNKEIPLVDRARNMVLAFGKFGVSKEQIERRLGHNVDNISVDELVEFKGILNSLKDGMSKVAEWFTYEEPAKHEAPDVLGEGESK